MTSVIRILISITSIIVITGEAFGVGSNTDWSNTHIETFSKTLSSQKYNDLDEWMLWLLRPRLDPLQTSLSTDTTITKPIACQHKADQRNPRQPLVKIRGEYGGSSSVPSVSLTSYSSPLNVNGEDAHPIKVEHWILQQPKIDIKNRIQKPESNDRRRRSVSGVEISPDKNITATATLMLSKNGSNAGAIDCTLSLSIPLSLPTQFMEFWFKYIYKIMI